MNTDESNNSSIVPESQAGTPLIQQKFIPRCDEYVQVTKRELEVFTTLDLLSEILKNFGAALLAITLSTLLSLMIGDSIKPEYKSMYWVVFASSLILGVALYLMGLVSKSKLKNLVSSHLKDS